MDHTGRGLGRAHEIVPDTRQLTVGERQRW
jgi:hypothetical protein